MKKLPFLVTIAVIVLTASVQTASAVAVTLDFTAAQVADATWAYNQTSAAEKLQYPTLQLWFASRVNRLIDEWHNQKAAADSSSFCGNFTALSQVNKDAVCTSVGLSAGCTPCR